LESKKTYTKKEYKPYYRFNSKSWFWYHDSFTPEHPKPFAWLAREAELSRAFDKEFRLLVNGDESARNRILAINIELEDLGTFRDRLQL
jgi:hypothetical protein